MTTAKDSLEKLDVTITSKNLAKQIFAAELPEQYIKSIPAQSLFIAIKRNGLPSSVDVLEIASIEQCRIMIDFDCWQKSYFNEDNFWEWLSLTSEDDDLALLQKFLKCFDLKIITLLIAKYVQYEFFEEATDRPPGPGYYTPDKGRTWISINIEDSDRHFHFGRMLALLFETDTNLFYKLLSLSTSQTSSVLEEEAYQDKSKRLAAEGIPEYELAAGINNAASENQIKSLLTEGESATKNARPKVFDIQAVEPLIFDSAVSKLLNQLLSEMTVREEIEGELTYIMNAAIIMWGVEFFEYPKILHLSEKVKGAINIGLEKAVIISSLGVLEVYKKLGLVKIYQLGLSELKNLRLKLTEIKKTGRVPSNPETELIFEAVIQPFPEMPLFLKAGYKKEEGDSSIATTSGPIESQSEIESILSCLNSK
jgi:hypothetical protein